MHACGHDVHMAALVALAARRPRARRRAAGAAAGAVSAERGGLPLRRRAARARGARARSRPRRSSPRTSTRSSPGATVALDEGVVNASCDAVEITVARRAHPRRPTRTSGATRSSRSPRWWSRSTPRSGGGSTRSAPAVLTVGVLEGGSAENVIPAQRPRPGRAARPPPRGPPGAAGAGRARWSAASPPPTAARPASSSCPASPRSRTTRASWRARASCSPRAGAAAGPGVALVRLG